MSDDDLRLRLEDLSDNPSSRLPICLALDVSGSMNGAKLAELNLAIEWFLREIRADELAAISAEIAMVSFGETVTRVLNFATVDRQLVPRLTASGPTPMGQAVNLSLDMLEQAKRMYSTAGVDYFQPWLVIITDGEPTDDISTAVGKCRQLIANRKLTVFPIAIGKDANLDKLGSFAPNVRALRVESTDLREFFKFLSRSISDVSLSNPGDRESVDIGANAFNKFTVDWHTGMMGR